MRKNKRCSVQKLSPELQKRLNRSKDISLILEMEIREGKLVELSAFAFTTCILSYIHDDFKEIKNELNERGLLR